MIRLMKSTFYNEVETKEKLCQFIMNSDKLSMGEKCLEFEKIFAEYQGRKYAVFFNSGSSANLALIQALLNAGLLKKGDRVGFSCLTWATNAMPLVQLGLEPIPIDVSVKNLNINSQDLLNLKENLDALFITNLLGFSGDLNKIKEICKEKNILLIEDNCESLGSELNGVKLGNFGFASTFSFFVGHHLSTIEGGMVCTDNKDLYETLIMTRAHGWDRNLDEDKKRKMREESGFGEDFYDAFTFYTLGFNLRPMEITGFIGVEQMKYINDICEKRQKNFLIFDKVASKNPDIIGLDVSHMGFVSNFAYPVVFKDNATMKKYKQKFSEISEIRPVESDIHQQPFFKNKNYTCPNAKKIFSDGFFFPNNPELTDEEVYKLASLLESN